MCLPIAVLCRGGGLLVPDFQVGVHYGGVLFFATASASGIPFRRFFDHDDVDGFGQGRREAWAGMDLRALRDCGVRKKAGEEG